MGGPRRGRESRHAMLATDSATLPRLPPPLPRSPFATSARSTARATRAVVALDGVSVALPRGSFTAIMGPSGSGKSTFLNVAAGLDRPTSGTVALGDTDLAGLSERRLTILRRERIGFVFQAFNLLPSLTVAQNIGLPLRLDGRRLAALGRARGRGAGRAGRTACATVPPSSRAASSSGSRSPGRSSRGPRWCSPTSRPARSTPARGATCSPSCARSSTPTATRS